MNRSIRLLLVAALAMQVAYAQDEPSPAESGPVVEDGAETIFAPFPSRLRVALKDVSVIITWEDSADVDGDYAVYRHTAPVDATTFKEAKLIGTAKAGTSSYVDTPPDSRPYYYLVLGMNPQGVPYEVFIPLKNATISAVAVESAAPFGNPVQSIAAVRKDDSVVVAYKLVRQGGRYVIYRHTEPIISVPKLLDATMVASFEDQNGAFVDYPVPGISYYYAMIDETSLRSGTILLEPGINATTKAVALPAGVYRTGLPTIAAASRSVPLPYLSLDRKISQGGTSLVASLDLPDSRTLSVDTEKAVRRVASLAAPFVPRSPGLTIFEEDLKQASGGEDYTLKTIVTDKVAKGSYADASDQLVRFLSIQRSPVVAARAHYYRGQCLAMTGKLRDAFFEFLLAQDAYYVEANAWIDYILDYMRAGDL